MYWLSFNLEVWQEIYTSYHDIFEIDTFAVQYAKVFRNNFWMMHHGSKSPKRTTVWSTRKFLVAGLVPILVVVSTCGVPNIKLIQDFVSCLGQGVIEKGHQAEKNKGQNHTFST